METFSALRSNKNIERNPEEMSPEKAEKLRQAIVDSALTINDAYHRIKELEAENAELRAEIATLQTRNRG